MWSYYGSKTKLVDLYPPPKTDKIIEPFCGSAKYSLKYGTNGIHFQQHDRQRIGGMACKPCTTVSSSRNSFGLISYTACYVLGGLSALNLNLKR